jgi:hypothetical protein
MITGGTARSLLSIWIFGLSFPAAEILAKEFFPTFSENDLISLPNYHIYLRLMIDGVVSQPFSGETLQPPNSA